MFKGYKNTIIAILLACILTMAVGYSILSQQLDISGTSNISSVWDVKITDIISTTTGKASNKSTPTFTDTTAIFDASLVNPGDTIIYDITITNAGTFDAILEKINMTISNNTAIEFSHSGVTEGEILKAGENKTLQVLVKYLDNITTQPAIIESNLIITLDYKQNTIDNIPIILTSNLPTRSASDTHWFNEKLALNAIESIAFTTTNEVPIEVGNNYFDISEDQNGAIMAWYYDDDSDGLYEVNVGQIGGVIANADSSYLFYNLENLSTINLANLNTNNVTNMYSIFMNCRSLTSLDLNSLNTSNVTNMGTMFYECNNLTSLNLSNIMTSNVTSMWGMFAGCSNLSSLNINSFDTSSVNDMGYMFHRCSNLTSLDVSSFNTSQVNNMQSMFSGASNLKTIYASNLWNNTTVVNSIDMFYECTSLIGNISFDSTKITGDYANYTTGYFTYKAAPSV